MRALLGFVDRWSAERGDLGQVIAGIPYFYRQFGYDYGIRFPPERLVPPEVTLPDTDRWETHPATSDDIPAMRALQDAAQSPVDLRLPFSEEIWPALVDLPHVELAVAVNENHSIEGVARIRPITSGHVRITAIAASTASAVHALLSRAGGKGRDALSSSLTGWAVPFLSRGVCPQVTATCCTCASPTRLHCCSLSVSCPVGPRVWTGDHQPVPVESAADVRPRRHQREEHPDVDLGVNREFLRVIFPPVQADVLMW